jgi:hypothetical protein
MPTNGWTTSTNRWSTVIIGGAEDSFCGGVAGTCDATGGNATPNYWGVGGGTSYVGENGTDAIALHGLGAWSMFLMQCNYEGTASWTTTEGANGYNNTAAMKTLTATGTANLLYASSADAHFITTGNYVTNTCLTMIASFDDGTVANGRLLYGGFTGSISSCIDHAIDGWSLWGIPLIY